MGGNSRREMRLASQPLQAVGQGSPRIAGETLLHLTYFSAGSTVGGMYRRVCVGLHCNPKIKPVTGVCFFSFQSGAVPCSFKGESCSARH